MAILTYLTRDGTEKSATLPSTAGFTIKVVNICASSSEAEQDVWKSMENEMIQSKARKLEQEGCHALYELDQNDVNRSGSLHPYQLFCIIQYHTPKKEVKEQLAPWTREAILIQRTAREWIAVADGPTHFFVERAPVYLIKVLQHGMQIQLRDLELKFQEVEVLSVNQDILQKLGPERRCPFCQGLFVVGERMIQCPSCGTAHHAECWEAYGNRCGGPAGCRYGLKQMTHKG